MKNKLIIFVALAATTIGLASVVTTTINSSTKDLLASTIDFENEKEGIEKVSVRKAATSSKLKMSKVYVQTAHNTADGYDYLRFATSIKGNYTSVSYTRQVEGKADETQAVTSVYKGISANGETTYSNGSDLRTEAYTSTEGCYWACYTIKFTTDTYKDKDITVTINVDGKTETRTVNFNELTKDYKTLGDSIKADNEFHSFTIEKERFALDSTNTPQPHANFSNAELGLTRDYGYMLGLTTDGKDLYYAMTVNKSFKLLKYDMETKESSFITKGDTTAGELRSIIHDNGVLYIVGGGSKVENYGFKLGASWAAATKYNFANNDGTVHDIAINPVTGKYVVLTSADGKDLFKFYDAEKQYLAEQDKELQPDFSTGISGKKITSKSIQVDESYIYVFYKQDGFRGIRLGVYDWDGNLVKNIEYVNNSIYNYGTDDFSNGDFCILNNKIYFSVIAGWGGSNGANSELYSIDFSLNKTASANMSLIEKISNSNLLGSTQAFEDFSFPRQVSDIRETSFQGATTDGKYIYYLYATGQCTTGRIVKYNPKTNRFIGVTQAFKLRDAAEWNDCGSLFYYNGRVYAIGAGYVYSVAAEDINTTVSNALEVGLDTTLPWIPTTTRLTTMLYHPTEDMFYFQDNSGYVHKYTTTGELVASSTATCQLGEHQGLTLIEGRVFSLGSANAEFKVTENDAQVRYVYDAALLQEVYSDLSLGSKFTMGSQNNPIGTIQQKASGRYSNLQNFIDYNGTIYAGILVHSAGSSIAGGPYVFKLNFDEVALSNMDQTMLFGEKIEDSSFNETYSVNHLNNNYGGSYIQGLVAVGDTFYITNSNNQTAYVSKYNPLTNTFTKSSDGITLGSDTTGNAGRIFHYDNSLWVITQSGECVGVDATTLKTNNRTLTLTNLPTGTIAADVKYLEETGGLVVLDTKNNLHYLNESLELVKTVSGITTSNSRAIKSISASGAYVYVVSSKDSEAAFGLNVYDYEGNAIKSLSIADEKLGGMNANISCVADYKGKLLVSVLTWKGNTNSGIHAIDVK